VWRALARSAEIHRRRPIAQRFQVTENSGEPYPAILALYLFSKDCWRPILADKFEPSRPEMSFVAVHFLFSGCTEWLAGAAPGPNRFGCWPSGILQRIFPSSNSGEKMTGCVSAQIRRLLQDRSTVDVSWSYQSFGDQLANPSQVELVVFVVVYFALV
jgi:hypothetical protein